MTTTTASARETGLTRDQLVAMHPYVINIPDGKLGDGTPSLPTSVDDFRTVRADVDALFETHLPAFLEGRDNAVPLVIWAHGGLVPKESGLRIAHQQVEWWKANGAFPVHFVWETGLAGSLWDAVKDSLPGRGRGMVEELFDKAVEEVVRGVPASRATWGAMKTTAALANEKDRGGAWYFATKLGAFAKANPGAVTVHAVGHSAGSIFHSHLVPQLLAAGVPAIGSLELLAPAVRVAEFKDRVLRKSVLERIDRLALFTMSEVHEKQDTCIGVYGKSLLYLIRASLEKEEKAEILGLQECLRRDDDLAKLFRQPGATAQGEVMWSVTVGGGPFSSTRSKTHGGFDNDDWTMNSLARRILDREDLARTWPAKTRGRDLDDGLWPSREEAFAYIDSRSTAVGAEPRRRALCIGIDSYPGKDRLEGCVADAKAWQAAFEEAGFSVQLLTNRQATRERMVEMIKDLVVSSRAGDVLALQYAGHGTTVEDLDQDELEEDRGRNLVDEAICPVDFSQGNLLIDDDLGEIWDLLPDGVSLTMFFDSCHSGGNQRAVLEVPTARNARPRLVRLSSRAAAAYRRKRGKQRAHTTSRDHERGVFFGACQPDEVAWESNGQGDFTRRAVPLLREALTGSSNQEFFEKVLAAFGEDRRQTPVLLPPGLTSRPLLAASTPQRAAEVDVVASSPQSRRDRAVASILRGVADLIES